MLTAPLTSAYRSLVPERLRAPLRKLRSTGHALVCEDRPTYRNRLCDFYSSIGNFQPVVRTRAGTRLAVDLRDEGVGWPIFVQQQYEPAETSFISHTLRPGDVFVDIGANIGYFTTLACRLVGRSGQVVAFEPDPDHCGLLRGNLRLNGARNAVVQNCALGSETRNGRLYRSPSNFGDHRVAAGTEQRDSIPISIRRFDEACDELKLRRVDFIKIDVQGYEPYVFAGMGGSLDRLGVRTVLMELWPYGIRYAGGSPAALIETLLSSRLTIHELDARGEALPVDPWQMLSRVEAMNQERPLTFANLVLRKGEAR
jgi:FkbM family methyltransferase